MEKLFSWTETKYLSTLCDSLRKKRKPETEAFLNSLFEKQVPTSPIEISTRGYRKNIISAAIKLVESPWWQPSEGHLALHENIKINFSFCNNTFIT